jgi:hypothetical protein
MCLEILSLKVIKKPAESDFCDMEVGRSVRRSPHDTGYPGADRVFVMGIPGTEGNMYKVRVKVKLTL